MRRGFRPSIPRARLRVKTIGSPPNVTAGPAERRSTRSRRGSRAVPGRRGRAASSSVTPSIDRNEPVVTDPALPTTPLRRRARGRIGNAQTTAIAQRARRGRWRGGGGAGSEEERHCGQKQDGHPSEVPCKVHGTAATQLRCQYAGERYATRAGPSETGTKPVRSGFSDLTQAGARYFRDGTVPAAAVAPANARETRAPLPEPPASNRERARSRARAPSRARGAWE